MRKGEVHEAVYCCGSARIRLLLRSVPEGVPEDDVDKLTFRRPLGSNIYAVEFEQGGAVHTHFYPLDEMLRAEETEIDAGGGQRAGGWIGGPHGDGCECQIQSSCAP